MANKKIVDHCKLWVNFKKTALKRTGTLILTFLILSPKTTEEILHQNLKDLNVLIQVEG